MQRRLRVSRWMQMQPHQRRLKLIPRVSRNPPGPKNSQSSDGSNTSRPQCTFYLSQNGCKKGADCTYEHNWSAIPVADRPQRCKTCGGRGHRASECKAGAKSDDKQRAKSQPKGPPNAKSSHSVPEPPPPPTKDAVLKSMLADAASVLQQTVPVQATEVQGSGSPTHTGSRPAGTASGAGTGATPQANSVTAGYPGYR